MKNFLLLMAVALSSFCFAQNSYFKIIPKPEHQDPVGMWERPDQTFNLLCNDADTTDGKAGFKLLHVDSNANLISSRTLSDSNAATLNNFVVIDDENFLIGSCLFNEYRLIKCDTAGNTQVLQSFLVNNAGNCQSYFGKMPNGNLYTYIRGGTQSIVVMNQNGDSLSSIPIGDKLTNGIAVTGNNEFFLFSTEVIQAGIPNAKVSLVDLSGQTIWQKNYVSLNLTRIYQAIELTDGYILTGLSEKTTPFGNELYNYTLKIDKQGNMIKEYEPAIGAGFGISKSSSGAILLNSSDYKNPGTCKQHASRLASDGSIVWSHCFESQVTGFGNSGIQSSTGAFYFFGQKTNLNNTDIALIKIEADGGHYLAIPDFEERTDITCYPNPGNEKVILKAEEGTPLGSIQIYDAVGNKVYSLDTQENLIEIKTSGYSEGVYFYQVYSQNSPLSKGKFIVKH